MKIRRDEGGQVLALVLLSMTMLLGFMALSIDVGLLFRAKRNVQIAADAAAIAGALDYNYNSSITSAIIQGKAASASNGITDGLGGASVTINAPPVYGPSAGIPGFVEAVVIQPNPTFFMGVLSGIRSVKVSARAVAGTSGPGPGCIYTLGTAGFTNVGNSTISAPGCDIKDDGGLNLSGTTWINANKVGIVGSHTGGDVTPAPKTIKPVNDPLASLPQPTVPPGGCTTLTAPFPDPLLNGCYNQIETHGNQTLNLRPGLYIINGGISSKGRLTINGTGVTLYMTGGIDGDIDLDITAPTTGAYNGMALWLSRNDSAGITITGHNDMTLQGIVYAPASSLTFSGNSPISITTVLIVKDITFSGYASINNYLAVNGSTPLGRGSGNGTFALVE